jgi:hypothetical protein
MSVGLGGISIKKGRDGIREGLEKAEEPDLQGPHSPL